MTVCNVKKWMKCVHAFRTGRHKRQADITLLFQYITFEKIISKQSFFVSDRTTNMQFRKMQKIRVIGYDTVPHQMYQPSLHKVHKKNAVFIFLLQPLLGHCLCSNSHHKLSVIAPNDLTTSSTKNAQIWHTPANITTNWKYNTDNNNKIRCHSFDWEPAMILEPVIMEYKRKNGLQSFLNVTSV